MKYFHACTRDKNYIFKNKEKSKIKEKLKKIYKDVNLYEISNDTYNLLKSMITCDTNLDMISDINNIDKSLKKNRIHKIEDFIRNKTLNDIDIILGDPELVDEFYQYFMDKCYFSEVIPKHCICDIDSMSIDNYYHTEHFEIFYINTNFTILDKIKKCKYFIKTNLGFYFESNNGNYWGFDGSICGIEDKLFNINIKETKYHDSYVFDDIKDDDKDGDDDKFCIDDFVYHYEDYAKNFFDDIGF